MTISNITMSAQAGYVLVERAPNSEINLDEQPGMLDELCKFCREFKCNNVLLRGDNVRVNLSVYDIFELGKRIARTSLRVAMVESHDAIDEDVDLLETVVKNRGGSIQFFDSETDAKSWLGVSATA